MVQLPLLSTPTTILAYVCVSSNRVRAAGESAYCVAASMAGGTRVVLVASEPITKSSGDWVAVPRNTALVITREKEGFIDIMRTPLHASGAHARQEEVRL